MEQRNREQRAYSMCPRTLRVHLDKLWWLGEGTRRSLGGLVSCRKTSKGFLGLGRPGAREAREGS